jgi:hypothetical protein
MYAQYKERHNNQPLIAFNIALHVHVHSLFHLTKEDDEPGLTSSKGSGRFDIIHKHIGKKLRLKKKKNRKFFFYIFTSLIFVEAEFKMKFFFLMYEY